MHSPHIMGEFTIRTSLSVFVWFVSVAIIGINLYIVGGFLLEDDGIGSEGRNWVYAASAIGGVLYISLVCFLIRQDLRRLTGTAGIILAKFGVGDMSDITQVQYHRAGEGADLLSDMGGSSGRHERLGSEDCGSDGSPEAGRLDGEKDSGHGREYRPVER